MESVVVCCVCNGRMREPIKTLPCLHSACLQCLKSYAAKSLRDDHDQADSNCNAAPITCINGGGGGGELNLFLIPQLNVASSSSSSSSRSSRTIVCLRCQSPCEIPLKGAEDLPTNYFTAGVVTAAISSATIDPNKVKCELCDEETAATVKCTHCHQFQCDSCKRIHVKTKATSHHQFVTVRDALRGGSSSSAPRILHCHKHPQYEVNSYCKTDQTAACPQCVVEFHQGHEFTLLSTLSEEFKDTISALVNKVRFQFVSKVLR